MATPIFPSHEQSYPNQLLPTRLEEYVFMDGRPPTQNRAVGGIPVTGQQILDAVTAAQEKLNLKNIDPRYYVGTAFHEAGVTNEWDTEIATSSDPTGFMSVGVFQIGEDEANRYGFQISDMLDLQKATECMVQLAEANRSALRMFMAKQSATSVGYLSASSPDPGYMDASGNLWAAGNMRAYLSIAHNQGVGAAQRTIAGYGMDWAAYCVRNPTINVVSHGYGADVITGGAYWPGSRPVAWPPTRILKLTSPPMRGSDVANLQAKLAFPDGDQDGVFGDETDHALRVFQSAHSLTPDGECGPETVVALA